jgi:hypothetical protein
MRSSIPKGASAVPVRLALVVLAAVMVTGGLSVILAGDQGQKAFATPEEAVQALVEAAKANNVEELLAIFGPEAQEILSSGDPVADHSQREVVVIAFEQGWHLMDQGEGAKEIIVGDEDWPFPIPLVREANGWRFDTAAGAEEILARRVGRNELGVIQICLTYVQAQQEYASLGHDGKPAGLYAQKVASEPGKQDGLYWEAKPGERPSPVGELAAQAAAEGYTRDTNSPRPFHGYYFRILTAQGDNAPGGARDYIVNGDLVGGFALVAYPAEYGNSGVMTFMVNQDGIVYEKDLGEQTSILASEINHYNPDETWGKVE